ncbi:uncharacterized protein KQ657_000659 [Scheffersomyces spartinae]|uniref:Uncharacterized protein n=1 Tax=Scheffersomyces spartinae TaxID=45513 RepID=A0A9P8AI83_9ASCO|nr:uncharacterized protein KQ657_000659 [Scheffersomyces spartinae]KAG7193588.1 hypothetical protein KQ657_000659 [Scheffersomyces spartinae]
MPIISVGGDISPFTPETRDQIDEIFNTPSLSITKFVLPFEPGHCIGKAQNLFRFIDEKKIEDWKANYGGQKKRDNHILKIDT